MATIIVFGKFSLRLRTPHSIARHIPYHQSAVSHRLLPNVQALQRCLLLALVSYPPHQHRQQPQDRAWSRPRSETILYDFFMSLWSELGGWPKANEH